jgi:hypothetical protein
LKTGENVISKKDKKRKFHNQLFSLHSEDINVLLTENGLPAIRHGFDIWHFVKVGGD